MGVGSHSTISRNVNGGVVCHQYPSSISVCTSRLSHDCCSCVLSCPLERTKNQAKLPQRPRHSLSIFCQNALDQGIIPYRSSSTHRSTRTPVTPITPTNQLRCPQKHSDTILWPCIVCTALIAGSQRVAAVALAASEGYASWRRKF